MSTQSQVQRGIKRTCTNSRCQRRYYDLRKSPPRCPFCNAEFDVDHLWRRVSKVPSSYLGIGTDQPVAVLADPSDLDNPADPADPETEDPTLSPEDEEEEFPLPTDDAPDDDPTHDIDPENL